MEKMPHALIHLTAAWSFGSKLDGTLKIVTYHTNSVKKEFTHGFGKSQIRGGANAPTTIPPIAILLPLKLSAGVSAFWGSTW